MLGSKRDSVCTSGRCQTQAILMYRQGHLGRRDQYRLHYAWLPRSLQLACFHAEGYGDVREGYTQRGAEAGKHR